MPIVIVQLRHAMFTDSTAQASLAAMSATDELVLVGSHHVMPEGRVSRLRRAIAPRHLVALLVDDHVPAIERALIEDLLNDGAIPVILTPCDPPPAALTSWLDTAAPRSPQVRIPRTAPQRACRRPRGGVCDLTPLGNRRDRTSRVPESTTPTTREPHHRAAERNKESTGT